MDSARGASHMLLFAGGVPERAPGAIFEVPGEGLEAPPNNRLNLHDFRWDHALYAGRRIYGDDFPVNVSVLLIEAARIDLGLELSDEVADAAVTVEARIRELIAKWVDQ